MTAKKKPVVFTVSATKSVSFDIDELRDMLGDRELREMVSDAQVLAWAKGNKDLHEDMLYDSDYNETNIVVTVT